jgi:hypothetical protein
MELTNTLTNAVLFKIYKLNLKQEQEFFKDYHLTLDLNIGNIKEKIAIDLSDGKNNYVNLENITERIYKDFGKLFFERGVIPGTVDNYKLEQFTNEGRTFSFIAELSKAPQKQIIKNKNHSQNSTIKKLIQEDRKLKDQDSGFVFYDDDFPPLG